VRAKLALVIAVAVGGLFACAPVFADEGPAFPDLPGMKLADEATRGEVAPSAGGQRTFNAPEEASAAADKSSTEKPDVSSIQELPGTAQIPVIGQMKADLTSSRRETDTMPRGLAALAAIGTIVSVGAFLLFRDRVLGR
jgi:hypothetical protein